jgi:thiamine biosynthesis lipoprotein
VLNGETKTISFNRHDVELDLGGIAKGYAVDRAARVLRNRGVEAALISAGGSTVYALGAPPARKAWSVTIQDPIDRHLTAFDVQLKDRAVSVAGVSEKSFDAAGVTYSHILDPRTGWPAQGVLSVVVLASSGTAGDALDTALFVLGPEQSRRYVRTLSQVEAFFFVPQSKAKWTMVHLSSG